MYKNAKKITNEEIRKRMGSKRNIILRIKERKLNLFGHICRMEDSRLVKELVFGEMKGKKRGRPKREWLDDVKEWCNEEIYILKRKAQDRDAWKNSQVCIGHQRVMNLWNNGWMDVSPKITVTWYFSNRLFRANTSKFGCWSQINHSGRIHAMSRGKIRQGIIIQNISFHRCCTC